MMQLGAEGVFVGSRYFSKSGEILLNESGAIVKAVTNSGNPSNTSSNLEDLGRSHGGINGENEIQILIAGRKIDEIGILALQGPLQNMQKC